MKSYTNRLQHQLRLDLIPYFARETTFTLQFPIRFRSHLNVKREIYDHC